jgi:hypothetical protein
LSEATPSTFGARLVTTTAAGAGVLDAHRAELEQQLPARPAPTGLMPGPGAELPASRDLPAAAVTGPAAVGSGAGGPLNASGRTDPALADQWSAAGASAISHTASAAEVDAPNATTLVRPVIDESALPAARIDAPASVSPPAGGQRATAAEAKLLDSTMGPEVHARVSALLAPAAAAGAKHMEEVSATRTQAETQVAAGQAATTTRQQAVTSAADQEVSQLRSDWAGQRAAIIQEHNSAIQSESGQARSAAAQTIATANAQAKAHADNADRSGAGGGQGASTSLWDRVKAAGRSVVSAVGGAVSSVLATVQGILDAARQRVLGAFSRLAAAVRERVAAAAGALRAGVRRVAGAIHAAISRAQQLVTRLAAALVSVATSIWRAAAQRLSTLWQALQAAARAALAATRAVAQRITAALGTVAEILKLLGSKVLGTIFAALKDPQGKVVAPIVAMAAPLAARVPNRADEVGQQHLGAGNPSSSAPVVQRDPARATAAPTGESFAAAVWRHVKAAGANFAANWGTVLAKLVLAILLWFPMIVEEGPKLWEECKGIASGGGGVDRLDHVLGVLRRLVNIVAGTLATVGVWAMLFAWAGTPIAEAATIAAYEAVSLAVLAADVALAVLEMGKAWYSATRPGVGTETRERYLEMFTASLISTVIAGIMVALGVIASRLAKAFKSRGGAGAAAVAEAESGTVKSGGADSGGERPAGAADGAVRKGAPLTPEEVQSGVRVAKDLPDGGRLRLLRDGKLVVCHSPCQSIEIRFRRELSLPDPDAQALRGRLNVVAEQERASVAAGDAVAEENAFNAADVLNQDLEAFRLRRLRGATGVDEATLRNLIRAAADDSELVERLLARTGNDTGKVQQLLTAARGDVNALARLSQAVDGFPARQTPAGPVVRDPRFAPFATEADMTHFLERHSIDHFDFAQVRAQNTFWPRGTTPARIQEALVETLELIRRNGDRFPPNEPRIYRLHDGTAVQVTRDAGEIVQFFPLDGPGVTAFTREEMNAIGRVIGRLP